MVLDDFIHIASVGVETAMLVSAPVLLMGLTAGVLVSILQAATQISDASLAFIPKMVAAVAALALFGSWMIAQMAAFAHYAFMQISNITT